MSKHNSPSSQGKVIEKHDMQRLISKNILISVLFRMLHMLTRFVMPPLILYFIGLEEYGIWTLCFTLITYLGLSAFGVSNVYIRYVAEYHAKHQIEKINELLSTGIIVVSSISLLLLWVLWWFLPTLIIDVFSDIPPDLHYTSYILFYGTACIFMLHISLSAFRNILNGLQRIAETIMVQAVCTTIEAILIVVFLFSGFGVFGLLYATIVQYVLSISAYIYLSFRLIPGLSLGLNHFRRSYLKLFYQYGGIVQLSSTLSIMLISFDRLTISMTVGVPGAGLLDVGKKFPVTAMSIPDAMNAVYLPAVSYMHNQNRQNELIKMYLDGSRAMSLLSGIIMGFLAAFAVPLIAAWLGNDPKYAVASTILILFTLPQHIHVLTGPSSAFFNGIEQPVRAMLYPLSNMFLLLVVVPIVLLSSIKITLITVVSITVSTMLLSAIIFIIYSNFVLNIPQKLYFSKVILPGLMPYLIGFLLFSLLNVQLDTYSLLDNRWYAISIVLVGGAIYTVLTLLCIYFLVYTRQERSKIKCRILRLAIFVTDRLKQRNKS